MDKMEVPEGEVKPLQAEPEAEATYNRKSNDICTQREYVPTDKEHYDFCLWQEENYNEEFIDTEQQEEIDKQYIMLLRLFKKSAQCAMDGVKNGSPDKCTQSDKNLTKQSAKHNGTKCSPKEEDMCWYYMVTKPFNKAYKKYPEYFANQSYSSEIRTIRDKMKTKPVFICGTRETLEKKTHNNFLVYTHIDMEEKFHDVNTKKFRYYCKPINDLGILIEYILKESKRRIFNEFTDYSVYPKFE